MMKRGNLLSRFYVNILKEDSLKEDYIMKEELDKLSEILSKITGYAIIPVCIYLCRSLVSDAIICGGVLGCVWMVTRIWI